MSYPTEGASPVTLTRRTAFGLAASVTLAATSRPAHSAPLPNETEKAAMPNPSRLAYVGCRTTRERSARGDGISVYRAPGDGAPWERVQLVDGVLNPSFLAFNHQMTMLYTVHGDASEVSAFHIDATDGRLTFVNQVNCRGKNPVHLVLDPSGRFMLVANHITSGQYVSSLAVIAIDPDGALGEITDHVPLTGKLGPHRAEQPFAKPHQVVYDPAGRFVAVPDKGLDLVVTYRLDDEGKLQPSGAKPAVAREGAGPRHLSFHPTLPYAYVVNELSSTVMACRYDESTGAIVPRQEVSALPDTFIGFSRASEIDISPDGRFVYVSNRGHESIGTFVIEPETGRLSPVGWVAAEGKTPRFFALDTSARHLISANEDSDTIVSYSRDEKTGSLIDPKIVAQTGSPTCILFS